MKIYPLFRAVLFRMNPELAHRMTLSIMKFVGEIQPVRSILRAIYAFPDYPVTAFGINFSNPIGLAAGYDKDGSAWRGLACLGFGHIEIGTVTPKPQPGNPKPRLFRLPDENALINRMGFPGKGADYVLKQISRLRLKNLVLGVNIGKNKDTALDEAPQDYIYLLRKFADHVDYLTINVSSPNTIGLRQLQERTALDSLLNQISNEKRMLINRKAFKLPILVKLSPDLTDSQLDDALDVILLNQIEGVIATNTTISREGVTSVHAKEEGGLSGRPLFERSIAMVREIHRRTNGKLPIIGAGGIFNATSVQKMMDAGAVLVQIYTGLIYEGPGLVKNILRNL